MQSDIPEMAATQENLTGGKTHLGTKACLRQGTPFDMSAA